MDFQEENLSVSIRVEFFGRYLIYFKTVSTELCLIIIKVL